MKKETLYEPYTYTYGKSTFIVHQTIDVIPTRSFYPNDQSVDVVVTGAPKVGVVYKLIWKM